MKHVPLAIVVGFAIGVLGDIVNFIAGVTMPSFEMMTRVQLATTACVVTEQALVALGLLELARRSSGRTYKLLRTAGVLLLVVAAWSVARAFLDIVGDSEHMEVVYALYRWGYAASGALTLAAAILLVVAAGARRAPVFALLALLAVLARGWLPGVTDELHQWLFEHRTAAGAYWLVNGLMWASGMLGLIAWIAKQALATADPPRAAEGFRYVANGLRLRIVAAIVFAVFSVGMMRSIGVGMFVAVGGPLVMIGTMVIVAVGCLRVAHAEVAGMPRYRLAIGAALTLWWAAVQVYQVVWVWRGFDNSPYSMLTVGHEIARVWSIAGPLIATAGLALVGSAISSYAYARANDELRESASVRTLLYVVLSASAVGIQSQVWKAETRDGFMMLLLVGAAAGIAALVSFAALAQQAADAIDTTPTLPKARVTSGA